MSFHYAQIQQSTVRRGSDFAVYRSPRDLAREEQAYYDQFPMNVPGRSFVATARLILEEHFRSLRNAAESLMHLNRTEKLTQ